MPSSIAPIPAGISPSIVQAPGDSKQPGAFQATLENAIDRVEQFRQTADQGVEKFLAGEGDELHGTLLAVERAELSFDLFLQVRNKVVDAYQQVMQMQM